MSQLFKLGPSDFAFLWSECKRCFYLKVKHNHQRPRSIMPKIFISIDGLMKDYFEQKSPKDIDNSLNDGHVEFGDRWIQSKPYLDKKTGNRCFIKGKTDTVLSFNDNSYGIVDFKTSSVKDDNVAKYSRQLHAYTLALENAAPGKPSLKPISKFGLFIVEPKKLIKSEKDIYSFENEVSWQEIQRDDEAFFEFLREVMAVLSSDKTPAANPFCSHCDYLKRSQVDFDNIKNRIAS